jgi:hypothetical protein
MEPSPAKRSTTVLEQQRCVIRGQHAEQHGNRHALRQRSPGRLAVGNRDEADPTRATELLVLLVNLLYEVSDTLNESPALDP